MKKIAILLVFFAPMFSIGALSQVNNIDFREGANGRYTIRSRIPMGVTIPHDPYLDSNSRLTKIELFDGNSKEGFFKYNVETERLESPGEEAYDLNEIKKFTFTEGNEEFINIKVVWPESEYGGFFKKINNSEFLMVKYFLEFKPRDYDPTMDVGNPYDRVEMSFELYSKLNEKWTVIPHNSKIEFVNFFKDYVDQKELKAFMRKNKIKLTNPEDIGKVINWLITKN